MKTLGLIGGTSWHATQEYYKLINEGVGRQIGTKGNPELIIYSLNIEIMRSMDRDRIHAKYLEVSEKLIRAGAEGILICANTPHLVYDYVQPRISAPILHIADATGKEAARLGLKKLGLLGNRPTMTLGFIPEVLTTRYGIETIIPESSTDIQRSHDFISKELTQGTFSEKAREFFTDQIELFRQRGVDGIILGCTELPLLIDSTKLDVPTLPTTDLHARMAVDFIMKKGAPS